MANPPSGAAHAEKRVTEGHPAEPQPGAMVVPPGRDTSGERAKSRNKARDAAMKAAKAAREQEQTGKRPEDKDMAALIDGALKGSRSG